MIYIDSKNYIYSRTENNRMNETTLFKREKKMGREVHVCVECSFYVCKRTETNQKTCWPVQRNIRTTKAQLNIKPPFFFLNKLSIQKILCLSSSFLVNLCLSLFDDSALCTVLCCLFSN